MHLQPARRILIYRLGSIGDFVVALPSLHLLERVFPAAERWLLTNNPVEGRAAPAMSVLAGTGLVANSLAYPVGTRNQRILWRLREQINAFAPDVLVYLANPRGAASVYRDILFFRLCGVRRIVGAPLRRSLRESLPPSGGDGRWEREAERLGRCIAALGEIDTDRLEGWDLRLTDAELSMAKRQLAEAFGRNDDARQLIGLSIGTKEVANDWGDDNWIDVVAALGTPNRALVLIGSEHERERSARLANHWKGPSVNLCGVLTPRVSAAVIGHAAIFLCHDSGPMHLAAAVGTRCVALFSGGNPPGKWFPFGSDHVIFYPMTIAKGIADIRPQQVIAAAQSLLSPRTEVPRHPQSVGWAP
jgi:heptosyltransferase III